MLVNIYQQTICTCVCVRVWLVVKSTTQRAMPGCPIGLAVESSEDSSDGDGDANDDEDDEVQDSEGGEETCPPGCDPGLYDKVIT